jgi:hypothetical protein
MTATNMVFVCEKCDNVDHLQATHQNGGGFQCYRCLNGTWHGIFDEEKYDPNKHVCINRHNPYFGENGEPSFS